MKNNLTQTGQWFWRDGEIGFATFQKLPKTEKEKHLQFLQNLPENQLSSNDKIILQVYGKPVKTEDKPFITLNV